MWTIDTYVDIDNSNNKEEWSILKWIKIIKAFSDYNRTKAYTIINKTYSENDVDFIRSTCMKLRDELCIYNSPSRLYAVNSNVIYARDKDRLYHYTDSMIISAINCGEYINGLDIYDEKVFLYPCAFKGEKPEKDVYKVLSQLVPKCQFMDSVWYENGIKRTLNEGFEPDELYEYPLKENWIYIQFGNKEKREMFNSLKLVTADGDTGIYLRDMQVTHRSLESNIKENNQNSYTLASCIPNALVKNCDNTEELIAALDSLGLKIIEK